MADPINPFDFATETLATFLAKTVGDGTYADVVEALKIDQVGEEAKATEIRIAAGQIYGNTIDDFVLAAYPLLRTVATGGGGGSRLAFNPTPVIGGTPFDPTYTAIFDEAIAVLGAMGPPQTFIVTLPNIVGAPLGSQVGFLLQDGNAVKEITFQPVVTDHINDPATGLNTGVPGTPLVIAAGTYASAVWLVWEAVQAAGGPSSPVWQYIGDRVARGRSSRFAKTTDATPEVIQLLKFEENLHTVQLEVWVQSVRDTGTNWRFERVKIDAHRIGGVTTIAAVVHETPVIAGPTIAGTTSAGTGGSLVYDYGVIGNLITVRITANAAENWDHTARIEFSEAGA